MGSHPYQEHLLQCTLSPFSRPSREKRALVAVGHSILKSVWHVLKEACEYKELGAEYLNQRMEQKRKNYLKKELEALGYKVKISRDDGPIPEVG